MLKKLILAAMLLIPSVVWCQEFGGVVVLEATVATDTNVYADHDQIGSLLTISDAFSGTSKKGVIVSVSVLDKSSQSSALTVHFFDASPTVASSDNAALNITDAELADKHIGKVEIAATDYQALSASSVATVDNAGVVISSKSKNLYLIVESAGTPTYTSATDLVLKIGIRRL